MEPRLVHVIVLDMASADLESVTATRSGKVKLVSLKFAPTTVLETVSASTVLAVVSMDSRVSIALSLLVQTSARTTESVLQMVLAFAMMAGLPRIVQSRLARISALVAELVPEMQLADVMPDLMARIVPSHFVRTIAPELVPATTVSVIAPRVPTI